MNKEIIKSHVDAIIEEVSEPINHNYDELERLNSRMSEVENIIEDSSLEYNDLYDMNDKIETLQSDFEDLDDKMFKCIEKVENVYSIDTQVDDDVIEVLNQIDNKLIKDLYFILNDKILDQGVTRLKQVSELHNEIREFSHNDMEYNLNKFNKLNAKIDNLANVIDGLLNGKIRLVKPRNVFTTYILTLSQRVRNIVRVGLAKVKGLNKRMMERKAKDGIRVDKIEHDK